MLSSRMKWNHWHMKDLQAVYMKSSSDLKLWPRYLNTSFNFSLPAQNCYSLIMIGLMLFRALLQYICTAMLFDALHIVYVYNVTIEFHHVNFTNNSIPRCYLLVKCLHARDWGKCNSYQLFCHFVMEAKEIWPSVG